MMNTVSWFPTRFFQESIKNNVFAIIEITVSNHIVLVLELELDFAMPSSVQNDVIDNGLITVGNAGKIPQF